MPPQGVMPTRPFEHMTSQERHDAYLVMIGAKTWPETLSGRLEEQQRQIEQLQRRIAGVDRSARLIV